MDWNHDGKQDHQDHAFYNNVVEPRMKSSSSQGGGSFHRNTSNNTNNSQGYSESRGKGWAIFIGICVLYLFIKLIGGGL